MTQESLLLGEIKLDEIQTELRYDQAEKVQIYGSRYNKKNIYKDSTLKGFENYSKDGELLDRTTFGGKNDQVSYSKKYRYDDKHRVVAYDFIISGNGDIIGQTADFLYIGNRLNKQVISLANIHYNYYSDGRLRSKSYYYNNRGEIDAEPWILWFIYDDNKNLIHVDADSSTDVQTMFYNEANLLIKNNYYPGVAYSTFSYDEKGNCIRQADFEMGKKDWDSTIYIFQYDSKNRLVRSGTENKKGKLIVEKDWKYNEKDQLVYELFYHKSKPKYIYRYIPSYFKE
ncbi:MAG: hypothetical protein H6582_02945 [Crocinitomicaceae bacterium]|nr:hypothetical protein [Crocinitomicaceae bacterium]